jgi:DNA repair protein RecO (recombination protein O)
MPPWQTPAIVLSVKPYGEADLLVTFLTPTQGRLTGIAKHARRSRRRFANCLEPLNRVTFFLGPRRGELEFLQKGELLDSFPTLRRDLKRLGAAALLAELAGLLAAPPEAVATIFQTVAEALRLLDQELAAPDSLLPAFLLRLLTLGGYGPRLAACQGCGREPEGPVYFSIPRGGIFCGACRGQAAGPILALIPGTWKSLRLAQSLALDRLSRLRLPDSQRQESLALLRAFLRHHLGRDLKAWGFWDKVSSKISY